MAAGRPMDSLSVSLFNPNINPHRSQAKTTESYFIFPVNIHPETILSVEVERAIGAVSVVSGTFEIDAQETLRKVDSGINVFR